MRYYLLLSYLLLSFTVLAQNQGNQPSERDLDRLDFWVGEWELSWEGGKGTNRIEKTLDGRVIQEHFMATEGKMQGFKGTSISTFNPRGGNWHQAWADNNGGYINLIGKMEGEERIFQTQDARELPDGSQVIFRMRFYDIRKNSFTWDWERSPDNGETWQLAWRILYTRKTGS